MFSDHEQLLAQPGIDVVAVTVKVPRHRELVSAALAAGQGVPAAVGLQARQAPAIGFVQELLSGGYVGEVLSTTLVGLSVPGNVVVQANAYMLDKANGANVLTIAAGHSLDTLNYVLGEFADLSAVADLRRPLITIEETGSRSSKRRPTRSRSSGPSPPERPSVSISVREWPAARGSCGKSTEPTERSGSQPTPPTRKSIP